MVSPVSTSSARPVRKPRVRTEKLVDIEFILSEPVSLKDRLLKSVTGDQGAGFAFSLILHAVLLAAMAVPIIRNLKVTQEYTTIVQNADEESVVFDQPLDTAMPNLISESAGGDPAMNEPLMDFDSDRKVPDFQLSDIAMAEGVAADNGNNGSKSGSRIAEPDSAIKAGNFSVWPWPVEKIKIKGNPVLGKAGEFPAPRQDYLIVIRILVPGNRKSVSIRDFSGSVLGTDTYRQVIPEGCYYFASTGRLVPVRTRPKIPVIDGQAELVVRVPGGAAFVEDTISIRSEILDEEQEIKLTFTP